MEKISQQNLPFIGTSYDFLLNNVAHILTGTYCNFTDIWYAVGNTGRILKTVGCAIIRHTQSLNAMPIFLVNFYFTPLHQKHHPCNANVPDC